MGGQPGRSGRSDSPTRSDRVEQQGDSAANTMDMFRLGMQEQDRGAETKSLKSPKSFRDLREERDEKLQQAAKRKDKHLQTLDKNPVRLRKRDPETGAKREKPPFRKAIREEIQRGYDINVEAAEASFT